MHPLEAILGTGAWAAKNTLYNLGFIPDDKLNWKPAPEANSAMEIIRHMAGAMAGMRGILERGGGAWRAVDLPLPDTREAAAELLLGELEKYQAAVRAVPLARLAEKIEVRPGWSIALARACSMPMVDQIHHHGQISYLQTLLGDTEPHFDPVLLGD